MGMQNSEYLLKIDRLVLELNLGAEAQERSEKQKVELSFEIIFESLPKGCLTDNLADTICYDKICKMIKNFCEQKEFNLIEKVAYEIAIKIKETTKCRNILVNLKKINPPIENLLGGVSFNLKV